MFMMLCCHIKACSNCCANQHDSDVLCNVTQYLSSETAWTLSTWWPCTTLMASNPGTSSKTYLRLTSQKSQEYLQCLCPSFLQSPTTSVRSHFNCDNLFVLACRLEQTIGPLTSRMGQRLLLQFSHTGSGCVFIMSSPCH